MSATVAEHDVVQEERLHPDCWRETTGGVELVGSRCAQCGTVYLPKALACVQCGSHNAFVPKALSPRGTLYTYTVVCGSGGVWPDVYAVGYVDYPEGVRVFGQIRETSAEALRAGAEVGVEKALLYRRKDGTGVTCFRFFIAGGDER